MYIGFIYRRGHSGATPEYSKFRCTDLQELRERRYKDSDAEMSNFRVLECLQVAASNPVAGRWMWRRRLPYMGMLDLSDDVGKSVVSLRADDVGECRYEFGSCRWAGMDLTVSPLLRVNP